jgi:[NiFe] hydrogenase small subunit
MEVEMEKDQHKAFYEKLAGYGVSRGQFRKYCGFITATLGLSSFHTNEVANVFASPKQRPPVVWLNFAECTGCSEALLRSSYPFPDSLILEILSIEYHETIMAAAGDQAEKNLHDAVKKYEGRFICVVEGAIATKFDGVYGKIGGRTFLEIAKEVCPKAAAVICLGSCSSFGGIQAAKPNPGGFKGVGDALDIKTLNIPGCPPNPVNFVGTVVNYLLFGKLPALDEKGRPVFAYGQTIHDLCPRRGFFEMGEFVEEFGSIEAELGYCLYKMGCKGPETYNNCPLVKFNDGTSWPVEAGHPCIGCSEPDFWDKMTPFFEEI